MAEDLCFCTIATKNRMAHVKVLAKSLLTHHPNAHFFWLLVDNVEDFFDPQSLNNNISLIKTHSLKNLPHISGFFFKYNAFEASTVLKPFFFDHLLINYNIKKLVYLDSDIYVTMNMAELSDLLVEHSIILTPHITKPLPVDAYYPNELSFLRAGTFNAGFISIGNNTETNDFLSWWKQRLWHFGLSSQTEGMFVDQKWMDLAPCLFEKVHILKDPGYNVAYWNLHERKLSFLGETIHASGTLQRFFHFSGFDPNNIESISKYQNRYELVNFPNVRRLFELYKNLLLENGYDESSTWPYSYDHFDNGASISDHARKIYWKLGNEAKNFGNPFKTGRKNSYFEYYLKNFQRKKS